jgi:hypothetical protein
MVRTTITTAFLSPDTRKKHHFLLPFKQSVFIFSYLLPSTHHGTEGYGPAGMVVDGDEIDEEGGTAHHSGQQEGGGQHLPHPHLPTHSARCSKYERRF